MALEDTQQPDEFFGADSEEGGALPAALKRVKRVPIRRTSEDDPLARMKAMLDYKDPAPAAPAPKKDTGSTQGIGFVDPSTGQDVSGQYGDGSDKGNDLGAGSVMNYIDPQQAKEAANVPLAPGFRASLEARYDAATPAQRTMMTKMDGTMGQVARDRADGYDKMPTGDTANMLDPSTEGRTARLIKDKVGGVRAGEIASYEAGRGGDIGSEIEQATSQRTGAQEAPAEAARKTYNESAFFKNPAVRGAVKGARGLALGYIGLNQSIADLVGADNASADYKKMGSDYADLDHVMGDAKGLQGTFENAVSSISQQLPALLGGMLVGGPAAETAVLGAMFVQSFGQNYSEGKLAGQTPQQAMTRATQFAFFEVLGEKFGLGHNLTAAKAIARGDVQGATRELAKAALKEQPGEQLTTLGQFWVDKEGGGVGLHNEAGLAEYLDQVIDTATTTAMQSALMLGGGKAAAHAVNKIMNNPTVQLRSALKEGLAGMDANPAMADKYARQGMDPNGATVDPATTRMNPTQLAKTNAEPAADLNAQIKAMLDPGHVKDAVFVAAGNEAQIPTDLPPEVKVVQKPEGTLLTTNTTKANEFNADPTPTNDKVASILGIPETKDAAAAGPNQRVVQALDAQGNVVMEALASDHGNGANEAAVRAQVPAGGTMQTLSTEDALKQRDAKLQQENVAPGVNDDAQVDKLLQGVGEVNEDGAPIVPPTAAPTPATQATAPSEARQRVNIETEQGRFDAMVNEVQQSLSAKQAGVQLDLSKVKMVPLQSMPHLQKLGEAVKKAFGVDLLLINAPEGIKDAAGKTVLNGFPEGISLHGSRTVVLNTAARGRSIMNVLNHELAHQLRAEHPEIWNELAKTALSMASSEKLAQHNAELHDLTPDVQREEAVSEIIGEQMGMPGFWNQTFAGKDASFVESVKNVIGQYLNKLTKALQNAGWISTTQDVQRVRDAVNTAYSQWQDATKQAQEATQKAAAPEAPVKQEAVVTPKVAEAVAKSKKPAKKTAEKAVAKEAPAEQKASSPVEPVEKKETAKPAEKPAAKPAFPVNPMATKADAKAITKEQAQDKLDSFDLDPETKKGQVRAYAAKLLGAKLIEQNTVNEVERIGKDRDMGPEDMVEELRSAVEYSDGPKFAKVYKTAQDDAPTISLQDLVGKRVFPIIADLTAVGSYSGIDSSRLTVPIGLQGGPNFPFIKSMRDAGVVWATDGKATVSQKVNKLGDNVYAIVTSMLQDSHKSNTTVAKAIFDTTEAYIRDGRINKAQLAALNSKIKAEAGLEDFPGFDKQDAAWDFLRGKNFDDRARFSEVMGLAASQKLGVPNVERIMQETRDQEFDGTRWGDSLLVIKINGADPVVRLGEDGTTKHDSYEYGIRGEVVGKFAKPVNFKSIYDEFFAARREAGKDESGDRRAFELSKPVQTVTQEIADRVSPGKYQAITSARQAQLAAAFSDNQWRDSATSVKNGGISNADFLSSLAASPASPTLSTYSLPELVKLTRSGDLKVFQLGKDSQIYFALRKNYSYEAEYGFTSPELTDKEVALVSVINNERGAKGIGGTASILKGIEQGATVLDSYAVKSEKFPDGFLPALYGQFGFEKVGEIAFNPQYVADPEYGGSATKFADLKKVWADNGWKEADGYPAIAVMKWKGNEDDRVNIVSRYLEGGIEGISTGVHEDTISAAEGFAQRNDSADQGQGRGSSTDGASSGGRQGNADRTSLLPANRAAAVVAELKGLPDSELTNLGFTGEQIAKLRTGEQNESSTTQTNTDNAGRDNQTVETTRQGGGDNAGSTQDAAGRNRSDGSDQPAVRPDGQGDNAPSSFRLARAQDPVAIREQQPDAAPPVTVTHYSHTAGLTSLSGEKYGSGIGGKEDPRLQYSQDPAIKKRISFYVDGGGDTLPSIKEAGLGKNVYHTTLGNLYDFTKDPKGILAATQNIRDKADRDNARESMVVQAGYDGYQGGHQVVVLGDRVPVQHRGTEEQGQLNTRFARVQTDTPAFKTWFGDSKVVDAQGKPLVVYHGTAADFSTFKPTVGNGMLGDGVYLSHSAKEAASYAGDGRVGASVMPLYLRMENPLRTKNGWDAPLDWAKRGYDGVIMDNGRDPAMYVVKDSAQAKSAIGNHGTFDANNPDIRFARQKETVGDNLTLPAETRRDSVQNLLQDNFNRVKNIQEAVTKQGGTVDEGSDIYKAQERFSGTAAAKTDWFTRFTVRPLIKDMAKAGVDMNDVALYLYASHATERNARIADINPNFKDGGSGMTNAEAKNILDGFKADPKFKDIQAFGQRLQEIAKSTQQVMIAGGLVSPEVVAAWNNGYKSYVPLKGFENIDELGVKQQGGGSGFDVRGPDSRRALGRSSRAAQIIENIIGDHERAIVRAEKNKVARALLKFVRQNPDDKLWEVNRVVSKPYFQKSGQPPSAGQLMDGEVKYRNEVQRDSDRTITAKVNGQEYSIIVNDNKMLQQLKGEGGVFNYGGAAGVLFRGWASINQTLTKLWTSLNPVFTLTNFARDFMTAGINGTSQYGPKFGAKTAAYAMQAIPSIVASERSNTPTVVPATGPETWSQWYHQYQEDGGKAGFYMFEDLEAKQKTLQQLFKDAEMAQNGGMKKGYVAAKQFLKGAEDLIMDVNGGIENGTRVGAYRAAIEMGKTRAEASSIAKNLTTNFNRKGVWSPAIGSVFLFFNPSVQGISRMVQAAKANPKTFTALVGGLVSMGLVLGMMGADDKDEEGVPYWDKGIPDYEKQKSLIMMTGGGTRVNIPMAYGYGWFVHLGYMLSDIARGHSITSKALESASAFIQHFSPINGNSGVMMALVPTALQPMMQHATNISGMGTPLRPNDASMNGTPTPDSERYWGATRGTMFQQMTDFLNEATGGNKAVPGAVSMSPEVVKNYITGYTGGAGGFVADIAQTASLISGVGMQAALDKNTIPFRKQFYKVDNSKGDQMYFMQESAKALESLNEMKQYYNTDKPWIMDRIEKNKGLSALGAGVGAVQRAESMLRKMDIAVQDDESLSTKERYDAREEIDKQRRQIWAQYNKALYDIKMGKE